MLNNLDCLFSIIVLALVCWYALGFDVFVKPLLRIIVKLWHWRPVPRPFTGSDEAVEVQTDEQHQNALERLLTGSESVSSYVLSNDEVRYLTAMILHKIQHPMDGKGKTIYTVSGAKRGESKVYIACSALYDTFFTTKKDENNGR